MRTADHSRPERNLVWCAGAEGGVRPCRSMAQLRFSSRFFQRLALGHATVGHQRVREPAGQCLPYVFFPKDSSGPIHD